MELDTGSAMWPATQAWDSDAGGERAWGWSHTAGLDEDRRPCRELLPSQHAADFCGQMAFLLLALFGKAQRFQKLNSWYECEENVS